jgi:hypothetical protein
MKFAKLCGVPQTGGQSAEQSYRRMRLIGHATAVLALLSLSRAVIVYGKEGVGAVKPVFLFMLLFGWFIVIPATLWLRELMPRTNRIAEFNYRLSLFSTKRVAPPVMIVAFLWMALTTWQRGYGEAGFADLLHDWSRPPSTNWGQPPATSGNLPPLTNLSELSMTNWGQLIVTNLSQAPATK